jgi:hypothetical protein
MSTRLNSLSKLLTAAGIKNTAVPSTEPDLTDDSIHVTETVHLQVGSGYLNVTVELPNGSFKFIPANSKTVVACVKAALAKR